MFPVQLSLFSVPLLSTVRTKMGSIRAPRCEAAREMDFLRVELRKLQKPAGG